jgi:MFS family permease
LPSIGLQLPVKKSPEVVIGQKAHMEENKTKSKVGLRNWVSFIIIGLAGQFAWMVENMYLNKFIFSFGSANYTLMISLTVAFSAITAALTTIFMGGLTDKIGRRKAFIAGGYIIWGLATAGFGLVYVGFKNQFGGSDASSIASIFVIILDCVMTFFGSTSNDAAFNSYVTKNVKEENRGKVEGVLGILPLVAMLVIFVGLNSLTDTSTGNEARWDLFFYIIGGLVFVVGLISLFLLPKEKVEKSNEKYLSLLVDGFKPSTIKANKSLYLILLCYMVYGIATQIYFPYLMIYFQYSLGYEGTDFVILFGVIMVVGSLLSVLYGILADKIGKSKALWPITLLFILGLVMCIFATSGQLAYAAIAGTVMMFGYISVSSILNAKLRDVIPTGKEGIFMGIRILFVVMIPMCTGPFIGQAITENLYEKTYTDEYGIAGQPLPPKWIWLAAASVFTLVLIPMYFLYRQEKKDKIVVTPQ